MSADDSSPCCVPTRDSSPQSAPPTDSTPPTTTATSTPHAGMVAVPGGTYVMGERTDLAYPGDGDDPVEVTVEPFHLGATAVTNDEFQRFVDATGHVTTAEAEGWSFVFGGQLPDDFEPTRGVVGAEWWRQVFGASWRHPAGPQSDLDGLGEHPVVHVSLHDALAYCAWRGVRLPTEAEWERAARAGTETVWPWGDDLEPGGEHRMNVWQGSFPDRNTTDDGWYATCPVDAFETNPWGLSNMCGNVWELTTDSFAARIPRSDADGRIVAKGGSFLCHESYCRRYRPSGRIATTPDSSSGNVGFRVAA